MPKTQLPIANGFYVSESLPLSAQQCINMVPSTPQTSTITEANLFGIPGLVELLSIDTVNACRGQAVMAEIPYFVIGNSLYRVDRAVDAFNQESFSETIIGTIDGVGLVSVATNGEQLVVAVPGGKSYVYDLPSTTLSEITDVNFDGPADTVSYVDGFFIFTTSSGKKAINSPVNDARGLPSGVAYDALDFLTAEADPDQIRGSIGFRNQLHVLGSITTEVYSNIGRVPAPFERISGFVIQKGLSARFSLVPAQNTYAFIGAGENESPAVWRFNGNDADKISTRAIDRLLDKLTSEDLDQVSAWSYGQGGSYFVGFSLPATTIVYDFSTGRWHERKSYIDSSATRYRAEGMLDVYGRIMVCDFLDGRIGELDKDNYSEYGEDIRAIITSQPFDKMGEKTAVYMIEAVIESGVGDSSVEDPTIRLSWSDDGGRKYSNEIQRSMGKVGEYERRAWWDRVGTFPRSRVLRFEMSDQVKKTLIKVEADIA